MFKIDAEEEPVQWGPTEFISEKKKEEPKVILGTVYKLRHHKKRSS